MEPLMEERLRFDWLHNLDKALWLRCPAECEQPIGLNKTDKTLQHFISDFKHLQIDEQVER